MTCFGDVTAGVTAGVKQLSERYSSLARLSLRIDPKLLVRTYLVGANLGSAVCRYIPYVEFVIGCTALCIRCIVHHKIPWFHLIRRIRRRIKKKNECNYFMSYRVIRFG
jgi:uncharacterized membrane protein